MIDWVQLLVLVAVIYSFVLHELGHAVVAVWFGDPTPKEAGRITLNPIRSLDPVGSLILPLALFFGPLLFGAPRGILLGWAKPVEVIPDNLRPKVVGDLAVSLAGIAMNLLVAFVMLLGYWAVPSSWAKGWTTFFQEVARWNVFLIVLNLAPIPPFDGHHIFKYALPPSWRPRFQRIGFLGVVVVLGLMIFVPECTRFLLSTVQSIGQPISGGAKWIVRFFGG